MVVALREMVVERYSEYDEVHTRANSQSKFDSQCADREHFFFPHLRVPLGLHRPPQLRPPTIMDVVGSRLTSPPWSWSPRKPAEAPNDAMSKFSEALEAELATGCALSAAYGRILQFVEHELEHERNEVERLRKEVAAIDRREAMKLDLVRALEDRHDLETARLLCQRVVTFYRSIHGSRDPKTLAALKKLASLFHDTQHLSEAEPLYREVLAARRAELGSTHPKSVGAAVDLAMCLRDSGHLDAAEPILTQAVVLQAQALGDAHPDTLTTRGNLADVFRERGRLLEASSLLRGACRIAHESLGELHMVSLVLEAKAARVAHCRALLQRRVAGPAAAAAAAAAAAEAAAVAALDGVVIRMSQALGDHHPQTLKVCDDRLEQAPLSSNDCHPLVPLPFARNCSRLPVRSRTPPAPHAPPAPHVAVQQSHCARTIPMRLPHHAPPLTRFIHVACSTRRFFAVAVSKVSTSSIPWRFFAVATPRLTLMLPCSCCLTDMHRNS